MGFIDDFAFCPECGMPSHVYDSDPWVIHSFGCQFCGFHQRLEHYWKNYEISDPRVDVIGRVFKEEGGCGYVKMKEPVTNLPKVYIKVDNIGYFNPNTYGRTWDDVTTNISVTFKTFNSADAVYYSGEFAPDLVEEYTDANGTTWFVSIEPCYSGNKVHRFTDEDYAYDEIAQLAIKRGKETMNIAEGSAIEYDTFVRLKECIIKWYDTLCEEVRRGERKAPDIKFKPLSEEEIALRKKPLPDTVEGRFHDDRFPKIKRFCVTEDSPADMKLLLKGEPNEIGAAEMKLVMDSLGITFSAPKGDDA